ncbi:TlpA family protein disulfide reductase [Microlunatus endophyticus]|nr:TlpA disulfide reductase family protein [Microlunatus endophyticus]
MMRRVLIVLVAVLFLAGCSGSPSSTPSVPPTDQPASAPPPASSHELRKARVQAGIADCPASTGDAALDNGLPDITLACLGSDRTVRLAGLRGKPMVVNIWAQWCGPCRVEAPHLAAVAEQAGNDVQFIGIDYADPDPAAAIDFAKDAGWTYPQLQDYQQRVKAPLKIIGIPQTFLVDAKGRIVYRQVRPFSSDTQLRALLRDQLGVKL